MQRRGMLICLVVLAVLLIAALSYRFSAGPAGAAKPRGVKSWNPMPLPAPVSEVTGDAAAERQSVPFVDVAHSGMEVRVLSPEYGDASSVIWRPVGGASVRLVDGDESTIVSERTDNEGSVHIPCAAARANHLVVSAEGYGTESSPLPETQVERLEVTLLRVGLQLMEVVDTLDVPVAGARLKGRRLGLQRWGLRGAADDSDTVNLTTDHRGRASAELIDGVYEWSVEDATLFVRDVIEDATSRVPARCPCGPLRLVVVPAYVALAKALDDEIIAGGIIGYQWADAAYTAASLQAMKKVSDDLGKLHPGSVSAVWVPRTPDADAMVSVYLRRSGWFQRKIKGEALNGDAKPFLIRQNSAGRDCAAKVDFRVLRKDGSVWVGAPFAMFLANISRGIIAVEPSESRLVPEGEWRVDAMEVGLMQYVSVTPKTVKLTGGAEQRITVQAKEDLCRCSMRVMVAGWPRPYEYGGMLAITVAGAVRSFQVDRGRLQVWLPKGGSAALTGVIQHGGRSQKVTGEVVCEDGDATVVLK